MEEELKEIKELVQENNKILRRMQRAARIGRTLNILWWLLIIGASVGALYYIQPYMEKLIATYKELGNGIDGIKNLLPK